MTPDPSSDAPPRSPTVVGGYPPIADHALIGDGSTAALVGLDGTIRWLCLPRFDGPALFASLLDTRRGGQWSIQPTGLRTATQHYLPDTAVVVTDLQCDTGAARITDAMVTNGSWAWARRAGQASWPG